MTTRVHEVRQKAITAYIKAKYGPDDYCAACGIIRAKVPWYPDEPTDNGICCSACLYEYPELRDMSRDEVIVWLWYNWRAIPGTASSNINAKAAKAWLRIQARQGRCDDGMALVAARAFEMGNKSGPALLREYVHRLQKAPARLDISSSRDMIVA
jgi:hypothetical protein